MFEISERASKRDVSRVRVEGSRKMEGADCDAQRADQQESCLEPGVGCSDPVVSDLFAEAAALQDDVVVCAEGAEMDRASAIKPQARVEELREIAEMERLLQIYPETEAHVEVSQAQEQVQKQTRNDEEGGEDKDDSGILVEAGEGANEVGVNPPLIDEGEAAIKIQALARGNRDRQRVKGLRVEGDVGLGIGEGLEVLNAEAKIHEVAQDVEAAESAQEEEEACGIQEQASGTCDVAPVPVNKEDPFPRNDEASEVEEKDCGDAQEVAAMKIQALARGKRDRQRVKGLRQGEENGPDSAQVEQDEYQEEAPTETTQDAEKGEEEAPVQKKASFASHLESVLDGIEAQCKAKHTAKLEKQNMHEQQAAEEAPAAAPEPAVSKAQTQVATTRRACKHAFST